MLRTLRDLAYLCADGIAVLAVAYLGMRELLFFIEGVSHPALFVAIEAALFAVLALSNWLHRPDWRRGTAVDIATLVGLFQLFPAWVRTSAGDEFGKGMGFLYLVSDWNLLPITIGSFVDVAPAEAAAVVVVYLGLVAAIATKRRAAVVGALAVAWALIVAVAGAAIREDPGLFIFIFFPASLLTAGAAFAHRTRLAARGAVWASVFVFMGLAYVGAFPLGEQADWRGTDGITRLYPCDDTPPAYPLEFPRDLYVDPPTERIFLSYGPSSGMVVFDLETGCLTEHIEVKGMMRRLWSTPELPFVYGGDDLSGDLYAFAKRPAALVSEMDLFAHDGINDAHDVVGEASRGRLFVAHLVRAAVSVVDIEGWRFRATLNLFESGHTDIPAAVTAFAVASPEVGYVLTGPATRDFRWRLLRVSLDDLTVLDSALIPGGTTFLHYSAARDSLWVGDATADRLLELDPHTLTVRRTLPGPHFSVALAEVTAHGTMLAAGPVDPDLVVLCTETGEIVRRLPLGPKLMSVTYDPVLDAAFVASGQGVFRVDASLLGCLSAP